MNASRRRILFDANPLMGQRTGVGYYTTQLIDTLARLHPEVQFVGYYYNFLGRKQPPREPRAVNIRYRAIYHLPGPVVNLLRRFRVEIPIELLTLTRSSFVFYPNFLNHPSLLRTPSANVVHDMTFVDLPEYVARKNLRDLVTFMPRHIKRSRFLVTVSEFGKKRIHEEFGVPATDILVTPIPPETPHTQPAATERRTLEGMGITGKFILTLGTIEPRKNLPNMLDAYLQLPAGLRQEHTFVIAGKIGWNCEREVAMLEQMKQQGQNILQVGYVDEQQRAALYHNASLFTWASHYEGFGMPILEAMSYATPCAISNIPVFREVAGDTALYFDQQKPASIATAWQKLLTNTTLHKRLGKAGKAQADTYDWDHVASGLWERIETSLREPKHVSKIVIDARESGTSTGRYLDKLVEYLHQLKPQHDVVLLAKKNRFEYLGTIAPSFTLVETSFKEFTFGEQLGFRRQVQSLQPDLVHFPMVQQPVWYRGAVVTTMQDLTGIRFRNPTKNPVVFWAKQQVYKWVNKRVAHKSLAIITPTQFVKDDVVGYTHINPGKVTVTLESADYIPQKPEAFRSMQGKQFIMHTGRPTPHKNLGRLIDAFRIVQRSHPDVYLVLVGKHDANYQRHMDHVAARGIPNVVFTGFVSDGQLRWLLEHCAAYAMPSLSEGFSLTGVEAMMHGAPVASSTATCLPEVHGNAAHYFDPLDVDDIAAKLSEVVDNPKLRQELIAKGHKQAAKYSWERMAKQTLAVYENVLKP